MALGPAPDFQVPTTNGLRRLDSYRGRSLILAFFPLAFTGG
jgi:peroxiredoxin